MLSDTWLLITLRWRLTWNSFRGRKWFIQILIVLGLLGMTAGAGTFSALVGYGAGSFLHRFSQFHLDSLIPGLILTAVSIILLINSFGIALGSLFLTNDLDLLMTAPVNRKAVFISKILDGMTTYIGVSLVATAPALVTYGFGLHYGPLYYILALIAILASPLLPAGLGSLAIMLVARFAPARRVREVMGLAAALIGVACSLISNTSRLWVGVGIDRPDLNGLLALVQKIANLPIPTLLAGQGLVAAGTGNWLGALVGLFSFLVLNIGIFAGCVWLADSMYNTGWMRMQSSGTANRNKGRAAREAKNSGLLGTASPPFALFLKDWRVIPRDLRNFAQFLTPLFILPVIYLNFFSGGRNGINALQQANNLGHGAVDFSNAFAAATILFTVELVFNRIASASLSMEGKSYWLLKIAPIEPWEFIFGKFLTAMIPFTALSTALYLGLAIWRGFSPLGTAYGLFGILLLGAGELAVETGLGIPWANLKWDDPRKMRSGLGTFISFFVCNFMAVLAGVSLSLPLLLKILVPDYELIGWFVGPLLAILVVGGVSALTLSIALTRLPTMGEA